MRGRLHAKGDPVRGAPACEAQPPVTRPLLARRPQTKTAPLASRRENGRGRTNTNVRSGSIGHSYAVISSNWSGPTPQTGHLKSAGISVPS